MTLVLIHSPLVGPLTWRGCAQVLTGRGHHVVVPSFAKVLAAPQQSYYRALASRVVETIGDVRPAGSLVLVAHSGAGTLLPMVVDALGGGVSGALFADAELPHEGESLLDAVPAPFQEQLRSLARGGWLPTWDRWFPPAELEAALPEAELRARFVAELPEVPMAYLEERAQVAPSWSSVPCGYLRLSGEYERAAVEAEREGWPTVRLEADHLAMLTRPVEIATALERMAASVTRQRAT